MLPCPVEGALLSGEDEVAVHEHPPLSGHFAVLELDLGGAALAAEDPAVALLGGPQVSANLLHGVLDRRGGGRARPLRVAPHRRRGAGSVDRMEALDRHSRVLRAALACAAEVPALWLRPHGVPQAFGVRAAALGPRRGGLPAVGALLEALHLQRDPAARLHLGP